MSNQAAWINEAKARPFEIRSAPMWTPGEGEILIKNKAVAINPIDCGLQAFAFIPLVYPAVLGQDVAGEVVSVGPGVTRFQPGDRVAGLCVGASTRQSRDQAFQDYTILLAHMASPLPANVTFEDAAAIPLGCSTAACGLFQENFLNLQYPMQPRRSPVNGTILVWGGSSSVGSNGIQLAVAAGYEVIATASPQNFEYLKQLGASQVLDYRSPSIQDDLIAAFSGKTCAGVLDCIGGDAAIISCNVVHQVAGKGCVATTKGAPDYTPPEGITVSRIFGTTLKDNAVGTAIFEDFLPAALAAGTFRPTPSPEVVGKGLDAIQGAVDQLMRKEHSAKKLVVSL